MLLKLDEQGICVSTGSACSSGSTEPSHVLTAIGLAPEFIDGTLRISFGKDNNKEDVDSFTITAPESLAGIGGTIAGEDSASVTLQYDGLSLDDAMPQRTGLTPADAMFCLMDDLRKGEPVQIWSETASGTELVALKYAYDSEDGKIEKQVWLIENGLQPVCAELYADGARVLTIQVTAYQET